MKKYGETNENCCKIQNKKRRNKSIVMGNIMIVLYVLILIFLPGIASVFIANIIFAFGYSIKSLQETNMLYDSTATKGGEGLYPKINAKGASGYYILDGIASLVSRIFICDKWIFANYNMFNIYNYINNNWNEI